MSRLWLIDFILPRWPNARLVIQGHTHRRADHPHPAPTHATDRRASRASRARNRHTQRRPHRVRAV
jgi:hypothetical protein